jgi:gliding motility-associated-like protein
LLGFSLRAFAQPVPNFSANVTSGCAPLIVQFQDLSTNNPTSWKWDLGNGTTSTQKNPTATYFNPGSYTVKLIVENASGKDSLIKNQYIIVNDAPTVNFIASVTNGCYPLNVQFTDFSVPNSGTNTEWTWDFGDGSSSSLQNPSHTYIVQGSFSVTLRVKNSLGCFKFQNKPNYINTLGGTLSSFSIGSSTSCGAPATVSFINNSTGTGALSYLWNFGDGVTATQITPTHVYANAGSYTVTLITTNNAGCSDTLVKQNIVNVGTVAANFTQTSNCAGTPILFTNTSTPTVVSALWKFSDGTTSTQINAVKTFATPGTYQVKMIANFGNCVDSITKTLVITAKPIASFTQSSNGACLPPVQINFNSTSSGATTYSWDFGDGGTANTISPSHTYTQGGAFNVTLIVTNATGCSDTLKKAGAVRVSPPKINAITALQLLPYRGCAPYGSTFGAVVVGPEPITLYEWNFGDNTPIQNGSNPFHAYNNPGTYSITLIVTSTSGCKDTFLFPAAVTLNSKPQAQFSATPLIACANDDVQFTDASTGNISDWEWQFGDGGTSLLPNPIYNYTDTGYFSVTLIVSNNFCRDTLRKTKYIYINPPIARFLKFASCDTPFLRRFVDQSVLPITYAWTFGDGGTSTLASPTHIYTNPGLYNITLTVTNGSCFHTKKDSVYITAPNPGFAINGNSFCKRANVVFTATNIDPVTIVSYLWDFGDGNSFTTTIPTATYSYSTAGAFTPTLTITDANGCVKTVSNPTTINIYGPTALFSNPPGGTCINGTLNFLDASTTDGIHPIVQWIWDYGDGTKKDTLTGPPFSHQYNVQGSFGVKLTVTDSYGCVDTLLKGSAVLITKPVANFMSPDTVRCVGSDVSFTNLSQGVNLNYQWTFGDGGTATSANPKHLYADTGFYSIKLIISDIFGCTDTIFKPNYIRVANVKADFSFLQGGVLGLCYPFLIEVANKSKFASSISWRFGDGGFSNLDTPSHFYNYVGTYPLTLRSYGFGGCVDSLKKDVVVRGPTGTFTYGPLNFCKPDSVRFVAQTLNNATFLWDYGDGVIFTTPDSLVTHPYLIGGLFKPKMILIDAAGCQVPIVGNDTIKVADVFTKVKVPQTHFCDSVQLNFLDSTVVKNDVVNTYLWNFGDGATSNVQHPQHFYSQPGNYKVWLKVTTSIGCTYTDTLNVPINIVQTPLIKIGGDSTGCVNSFLSYKGLVTKSDSSVISWNWSFSNGNTSTLQNPLPQLYTTAGPFLVTAISSNASGCSDTVRKTINIYPLPNTDAGIDSVVCQNQPITLQATGAATYVWATNPTLSCLNCANPVATPDTIQFYRVTGYTAYGCSTTDSVLINVLKPFKIKVSLPDTLCVGESSQLQATGADKYNWSPATGLNDPTIYNPVAKPTVTTTYVVTGTDYKNCFNIKDSIRITVYPIPQFNIVLSNLKANVGNTVPLLTTSSSDITNWRWLPQRWLSCYNCPQPVAIITDNIKYVAEASNPGGCITRDEITIESLCSDANIFIPNTFSPNGDGANDIFYPRGKGLFTVKSLRIFNRWGEVVFSKTNFLPNNASDGWDGTFKGAKLSSDVYVYTMEIVCDNSQIIPLKGNVTLLR